MMRGDGPNDGLTLLPDILAPNSLSILAPRSDHFFAEDPEIDDKTLALLLILIDQISPGQQASGSDRRHPVVPSEPYDSGMRVAIERTLLSGSVGGGI